MSARITSPAASIAANNWVDSTMAFPSESFASDVLQDHAGHAVGDSDDEARPIVHTILHTRNDLQSESSIVVLRLDQISLRPAKTLLHAASVTRFSRVQLISSAMSENRQSGE